MDVFLRPGRPLMGESHGMVIMDGYDNIAVFPGQFQFRQVINPIPKGRSDDDVSRGIGFTDDGQSLAKIFIP